MTEDFGLEEMLKTANILCGEELAALRTSALIEEDVKKAKTWLQKQPDYLRFVQHLLSELQKKNIADFGKLLSSLVSDVLQKDKEIVLDLYTYHNLPALRIEAVNSGLKENIYEGSGGSIANIVSTGLRLIALGRLKKHRKFILLDEPDCWLKPEHVPAFAKIIGSVSALLGIQTVLVSHHDWSFFKEYARVIRLYSDGKNLQTEIVSDAGIIPNSKENYIRQVRLRNFMSHTDTTFDLAPGLTCLIGENDIGKSVLGAALKAVAFGDSSDSYIQHHQKEAQVLISLSTGEEVFWQRFLETSQDNPQKVKYSLLQNGVLAYQQFESSSAPQFVDDVLRIMRVEDIDVHIGNQKQPVFLLSPDIKPQERAKILSLGKEAVYVQKLMESIRSTTRSNKQKVKEGELEYARNKKIASALEGITEVSQSIQESSRSLIELKKVEEQNKSLAIFVEDIATNQSIVHLGKCDTSFSAAKLEETSSLKKHWEAQKENAQVFALGKLQIPQSPPKLENLSVLEGVVAQKKVLSKLSTIKKISFTGKPKNIENNEKLQGLVDAWKAYRPVKVISVAEPQISYKAYMEIEILLKRLLLLKRSVSIGKISFKELPSKPFENNTMLLELIARWKSVENTLKAEKETLVKLENQIQSVSQKKKLFWEKHGGVCPLCKQEVK